MRTIDAADETSSFFFKAPSSTYLTSSSNVLHNIQSQSKWSLWDWDRKQAFGWTHPSDPIVMADDNDDASMLPIWNKLNLYYLNYLLYHNFDACQHSKHHFTTHTAACTCTMCVIKKIKLRKIKIWMNPPINIFIADAAVVLDFLLCNLKFISFPWWVEWMWNLIWRCVWFLSSIVEECAVACHKSILTVNKLIFNKLAPTS